MKKLAILIIFFLMLLTPAVNFAQDTQKPITNDDVILYEEHEKWGLKDKQGEILIPPTYKKMIRIGYHTWLVQAKNNKFGITDEVGNVIVEPKYRHTARLMGKYAKLGNTNDFGLYNEFGKLIIPHEYSNIDVLFGRMFLTYKNYKYGIRGFDGKLILDNEYDDIYMPTHNTMRILYKGDWYEIEGVKADTLTLPGNDDCDIYEYEDNELYKIVKETGAVSGYSVVSFTDYLIKLFSSISPAHEDTVDELMLSYGADTLSIFKKFTWIPKYPVTYAQKYFKIIRNPNSGPLTDIKNELRRKI